MLLEIVRACSLFHKQYPTTGKSHNLPEPDARKQQGIVEPDELAQA